MLPKVTLVTMSTTSVTTTAGSSPAKASGDDARWQASGSSEVLPPHDAGMGKKREELHESPLICLLGGGRSSSRAGPDPDSEQVGNSGSSKPTRAIRDFCAPAR
mmetsp:Transcript_43297/g.123424  ORF Transcript_43297/g.123424 Transcript_43297/m.123424 type:complete len:104 (+) Transcript_43297:120-431(+)